MTEIEYANEIEKELKEFLQKKFGGKTLVNNTVSKDKRYKLNIVTPDMIGKAICSWYKHKRKEFEDTLVVERDVNDPNKINIKGIGVPR